MSLQPPKRDDPARAFATEVVERLQRAGFPALWAGGCVRDLILGLTPADYDVATGAAPDQVMRLFRRTVPVGVSFGVVRVLGPKGSGEVEVATFRTDGRYLDGRRPESVVFGTAREDASRRDFTINGMFLDPLQGQVIDYVGGQADLEAGLLRAIGDPAARFEEDKLRLLRAVRFAARFGFTLEPATRAAIRSMAEQVHVVAPERIAQELRRMLTHPTRSTGMALADELGLAAVILPEVLSLRSVLRDTASLWERMLDRLDALPPSPGFPLALAALLRDVGVPLAGEGAAAETGAKMTAQLAGDLRLSNAERDHASWLVRHARLDLRPGTMPTAAYKRLLASPLIEDLLVLREAELRASGGDISEVADCREYLREQPEGPIAPPALISGSDLIAIGLKPGPRFKSLLDAQRDAQLEGEIQTREEALAWVRRQVEKGD